MYIDLNIHIPGVDASHASRQLKKGKGPAIQQSAPSKFIFTPSQLAGIENRVDLLVHLGYTVLAFNQIVHKKVDPKIHINVTENLVEQLRKRPGVVFLKRITIVLDEDSEKGFGLTASSATLFSGYDIIALTPTTLGTFSLACLSHSQPSPLTAHIISIPLTSPRLPFHLKHTLVRTAIRNGAAFEINYAGAFGEEADGSAGEFVASAKRNWWASAREVVRVTKGKGLIVSGGVTNEQALRAPRDVANLITMLDLAPDLANSALTTAPQSLILRTRTRKTYRAILSEPILILQSKKTTRENSPSPLESSTNQEVPPPVELPDSTKILLKRSFDESKDNQAEARKKKRKKK